MLLRGEARLPTLFGLTKRPIVRFPRIFETNAAKPVSILRNHPSLPSRSSCEIRDNQSRMSVTIFKPLQQLLLCCLLGTVDGPNLKWTFLGEDRRSYYHRFRPSFFRLNATTLTRSKNLHSSLTWSCIMLKPGHLRLSLTNVRPSLRKKDSLSRYRSRQPANQPYVNSYTFFLFTLLL